MRAVVQEGHHHLGEDWEPQSGCWPQWPCSNPPETGPVIILNRAPAYWSFPGVLEFLKAYWSLTAHLFVLLLGRGNWRKRLSCTRRPRRLTSRFMVPTMPSWPPATTIWRACTKTRSCDTPQSRPGVLELIHSLLRVAGQAPGVRAVVPESHRHLGED